MLSFKQYLLEDQHSWQVSSAKELLQIPGWHEGDANLLQYIDEHTGEIYAEGQFKNGIFIFQSVFNKSITFYNDILIEHDGKFVFPFKFDISRDITTINVDAADLSSFIGFPEHLNANLDIIKSKIASMEGFPKKLKTLRWIDISISNELYKYVDTLNYFVLPFIPKTKYTGFLSFFKINGFKKIQFDGFNKNDDYHRAAVIVNFHLKAKSTAAACQTELMKNGLKEYAKY